MSASQAEYAGSIPVTCSRKKRQVSTCRFFSYIRLRQVILLCSDIRLTPSGIRSASEKGEYNITEVVWLSYHFCEAKISLRRSRNITKISIILIALSYWSRLWELRICVQGGENTKAFCNTKYALNESGGKSAQFFQSVRAALGEIP